MSNTGKRKKRSSSLKGSLNPSKRHRDRFNIELDNLAKLLPFPHDVIQKLDKLSILRLSASYLRAKNFFKEQKWDNEEQKDEAKNRIKPFEGNGNLSKLILEALDGFVIVLTQDFELFYASETIQTYLGLSQASVIHQDFLRFIHVDDHEMITKYLQPNSVEQKIKILDDENDGSEKKEEDSCSESSESASSAERTFVCRMKCILNTSAGFFKPFRCNGRLREMTLPESDKREYGLFLICTPMETMTNSILEIRLKTSLFCTKNRMDLSFMDIDQKGRSLLGYHKRDIALQSSYCMIHFDDIPVLGLLHKDLMSSAKCQGTFRMLNKNMKWQWLTGTAQVVFKGSEPDFIITTNRPLSDEEGEEVLRQRGQLPALPFTTSNGNNKVPSFFPDGSQPQDFKMPEPPLPKFFQGTKKGHSFNEGPHSMISGGPKEEPLSPQSSGSPFHEDGFRSTSCTSAPVTLADLELGVDLQEELNRDAPELMLLSQDFNTDLNSFPDFVNGLGQLAMEDVPFEDLPTFEDAMALAQECLSTPTESTSSMTSPCGSQMSYPARSPPHVQCDPFSPTSSAGHPSPFPSPIGSHGPSISPAGLPTPDPSPLERPGSEAARINISWQGAGQMRMPNQGPYQRGAPSPQQMKPPPVNGGILSKSARLASMQKNERLNYRSCAVPSPPGPPMPPAWSSHQPPAPPNNSPMQQPAYNSWNNAQYHNSYRQHHITQSQDSTWGPPNQGSGPVPPFEDTLTNINYPNVGMMSPPYHNDSPVQGFRGFPPSNTPVTSAPYSNMGEW
ncbi:aryl hydrocarbon receptor isoform X2 [Nematostella vectensis]|uniref:aryl hydrocarbon receptor isoform X2 n=1 Tax=Nematostella vectensis TaxID=45351 RepID=UPI0020779833|nr:aryl hydrocarbon receptor isoform X2 [Nematostella vectensis]